METTTTFQEMLNEEQKRLKGMPAQAQLSHNSLQASEMRKMFTQFLMDNNPSKQGELATRPYECIFGDHPELSAIRKQYGNKAPVAWLMPQLKDLSEFCGVRDKMTNEQLLQCSYIISTEYGYLKTSELMLFFHLFKAGRYGQFYGAVDPMKITTALRKFLADRNEYFYRLEQKQKDEEKQKAREGAVTYEEYKRMVADGLI